MENLFMFTIVNNSNNNANVVIYREIPEFMHHKAFMMLRHEDSGKFADGKTVLVKRKEKNIFFFSALKSEAVKVINRFCSIDMKIDMENLWVCNMENLWVCKETFKVSNEEPEAVQIIVDRPWEATSKDIASADCWQLADLQGSQTCSAIKVTRSDNAVEIVSFIRQYTPEGALHEFQRSVGNGCCASVLSELFKFPIRLVNWVSGNTGHSSSVWESLDLDF